MKGTQLGAFEELVLLVVGSQGDAAYGASVAQELEQQTGRVISLSPVHTALYRLEKKGFVISRLGGATNARGGRRKRLYRLTAAGRAALERVRVLRNNLWDMIPEA